MYTRQSIYVITNTENGKKYVGKSKWPEKRFQQHIWLLRRGCHTSKSFQEDFIKYGETAFTLRVVETVDPNASEDRELAWMRKLKTYTSEYGYNDNDHKGNPARVEVGMQVVSTRVRGKHYKRSLTKSEHLNGLFATTEQEERICDKYNDGYTIEMICEEFGAKREHVRNVIYKLQAGTYRQRAAHYMLENHELRKEVERLKNIIMDNGLSDTIED